MISRSQNVTLKITKKGSGVIQMTPKYLQNELLNELYINTMKLIENSNLSVETKQEHLIQACNVFAFSLEKGGNE